MSYLRQISERLQKFQYQTLELYSFAHLEHGISSFYKSKQKLWLVQTQRMYICQFYQCSVPLLLHCWSLSLPAEETLKGKDYGIERGCLLAFLLLFHHCQSLSLTPVATDDNVDVVCFSLRGVATCILHATPNAE